MLPLLRVLAEVVYVQLLVDSRESTVEEGSSVGLP